MKLRMSLVTRPEVGDPVVRDVTVIADVTQTVGEVAYSLARAGAGDPRLRGVAVRRHAPLTLLVRFPDAPALLLDGGDPLGKSGVRPGAVVEPVLEAHSGGEPHERVPAAFLTVETGGQAGVGFLIPSGQTVIGRDRSGRVELVDGSEAPWF